MNIEFSEIIKNLQFGDNIAFEFKFNNESEPEVMVGEIVHVGEKDVSVIFLYGYRSENETVPKDKILAYVDQSLKTPRIRLGGFNGHFILNKEMYNV